MRCNAMRCDVTSRRRYGPGSSDPGAKSECELGRAVGRVRQWSGTHHRKNGSGGTSNGSNSTEALVIALAGSISKQYGNSKHNTNASSVAPAVKFNHVFLSEDVIGDGQVSAAVNNRGRKGRGVLSVVLVANTYILLCMYSM